MATPLLATKLYRPPPRPSSVCRPRLLEQLSAGLHRKLTLVSAPAGFGKTTLVSQWLATCERPTAWLSLDSEDNHPARFVTYVVVALQTAAAGTGNELLSALQSPQLPPTEAVLTALLNELFSSSTSFVLVLDDYHVIDTPAVDDALGFMLEHLPPQLHLVIATREDPQLPLARLRARDELTELRAADLRFTPPEAAAFLEGATPLALSARDVETLASRTEGWIAGLQLAALSVRGQGDVRGFIQGFAGDNRYIVGYLVEEVLARQPEPVRSFLLQTSVLERLSGPLCHAVTGQDKSHTLLGTLEQSNLFVIPLDDTRSWYRYHHLFADVLGARLRAEQPEHIATLHGRASSWYEQNGLPSGAVHHALAAGDYERAAHLAEKTWRTMDRTFQSATWFRWVSALPDVLVRARPVLCAGYAWALLDRGEFGAVEARLRDAERWLGEAATNKPEAASPRHPTMLVTDEHEFRVLPVTIASARAYKAQALGDLPTTIRHASKALELLPEGDGLGRAIPNALLGLAYWASGDLRAAEKSLSEGMTGFRVTGNPVAAISGTFGIADIYLAQGRLREAMRLYEEALQLALQTDPPLRGTATLYLGLSELYREQGDAETAEAYLVKSETRGRFDVQKVYRYRWFLVTARTKEAQGDLSGALEVLGEAAHHQKQLHIPFVRPVEALKARVWVRQGELGQAQAWVRERGLTVYDALSYLREFEHLTLARVLIAQYESEHKEGALQDAAGLLARLLHAAEAGKRKGSVIDILNVQALAHRAGGDVTAALESLKRSLTLAEPEGYVQTFVAEGPPLTQLLAEAALQGSLPEYTHKLLAASQTGRREGAKPLSQPLEEALSERELEVLGLVAQGLSNREISRRLFRALDTVKGYNRSIFEKLGVQNRTEAVARARELGLL